MTGKGYTMDPAGMAPVMKLKERTPATVGDPRQTLGFLSYYRAFIANFSRVAHPLYNLLTVLNTEEHTKDLPAERHKKIEEKKGHLPSRTSIEWTSSHQEVLNQLIDALTKPRVPGYPDFTQPFVLHCDASQVGLGAVLYQRQQGKMIVMRVSSVEVGHLWTLPLPLPLHLLFTQTTTP